MLDLIIFEMLLLYGIKFLSDSQSVCSAIIRTPYTRLVTINIEISEITIFNTEIF